MTSIKAFASVKRSAGGGCKGGQEPDFEWSHVSDSSSVL